MRWIAIALLVLAAACSSDEPEAVEQIEADLDEIPTCADAYQEGQPVTAVPEKGCYDDQGTIVVGFGSRDCPDGRVLWWSDLGWYYEGDVFHEPDPNQEQPGVPPASVLAECP